MRRPNISKLFNIKFLLLVSILCLGVNASGEDRKKDWIIHAQSYIEADRLMALHGAEGKSTFLEDLKRRDETVKSFRNSTPPTIQEIEELLTSKNIEEQVIASVAIVITGNYSIPIVERLVNNLQNQGPFELKRYTALALKKISQDDLKPFEDNILKIIENESDEHALVEEMLYLLILDPEKSARALINLLINRDSARIKVFAYMHLHKLGPEYSQRAIEELKQKGDEETLKLIDKMSSGNPLKEDLDK